MDSKTLISQVREMQACDWKNSDLWSETQDELVQIADHLEQCPTCREAFNAQEYPEATLIDFEPRLANTPISDWICDLPTIDLSPLDYTDPLALLEQAYNREGPKQVLLVVEWEERRISAETRDPSTEGTPEYRWHGREDAYAIDPLVDATALRQWVIDEILPAARPLFAAYEKGWDGDNWVGTFPGHEEEKADFDAMMNRLTAPRLAGDNAGIWRPEEWLVDPPEELHADTPDDEIAVLAARIVREARAENALVVGDVTAYLQGMRAGMRDAPPALRTYTLRGYAALDKVAKFSGGCSARFYVPKAWGGKRVKAVLMEPLDK